MSTWDRTIEGGLRYRGNEGQWSYYIHRLSGLGVLLFLGIHILDTSTVYFYPGLYQHAIPIYRSSFFMLAEIVLVGAVIVHGMNGLRIAIFDLNPSFYRPDLQRRGVRTVLLISLILWIPAAGMMGRALYINNICQCPVEGSASFALPLWADVSIGLLFLLALGALSRMGVLARPRGDQKRPVGAWLWLYTRWSAILLIPLVWVHVLLNDVLIGVHSINLDYVSFRWAMLGWRVFDFSLLAFAFAHGMNGLRTVVRDYLHGEGHRMVLDRVLIALWILVSAIGAAAVIGGVRAP
jgi:succinate dehydrogenase cytochrome b556 subunit